MKLFLNCLLALLLGLPLTYSQETCSITYISNEGFLIESGGKKIIIDGAFETIDGNWCDSPTAETVRLIRKSLPPFDNIDIIAITHKHVDHFDKDVVAEHMINNTEAIVICPDQAALILRENPDYKKFSDRVIAVTPAPLNDSTILVPGVRVRVMRLEHSHYMETDTISGEQVNRHRDIENLGYLFDIDGRKFFHCGDTNPLNENEYAAYALDKEDIDIAFLERLFYARGEKAIEILGDHINPGKTVIMHINPANRKLFTDYFKDDENIIVFEEMMKPVLFNLEN